MNYTPHSTCMYKAIFSLLTMAAELPTTMLSYRSQRRISIDPTAFIDRIYYYKLIGVSGFIYPLSIHALTTEQVVDIFFRPTHPPALLYPLLCKYHFIANQLNSTSLL